MLKFPPSIRYASSLHRSRPPESDKSSGRARLPGGQGRCYRCQRCQCHEAAFRPAVLCRWNRLIVRTSTPCRVKCGVTCSRRFTPPFCSLADLRAPFPTMRLCVIVRLPSCIWKRSTVEIGLQRPSVWCAVSSTCIANASSGSWLKQRRAINKLLLLG